MSSLRGAYNAAEGNKNYFGPVKPQTGLRGAVGTAVRLASGAGTALGGVLAVGAEAEAKDAYDVYTAPDSTGVDTAAQVASGAGRLAAAGLGAKAGATLGAFGGPAAPLTVPLGGIIGGVAGYFGADKLIEGGRSLAGVDTRDPAEQVAQRAALPANTLRKTAPGAAPDPRNPYAAANAAKIAASDAQNKAAAAPKPGAAQRPEDSADVGRVIRNGNEYSGVNVGGGGNITINGFAPGAGLNRGSQISAQNMAAADNLAGGGSSLRSQGAPAGPVQPAMVAPGNSSNSWQARNNLRNLAVSASSITNKPGWSGGGRGYVPPDVAAFQAAQQADIALQGEMDAGSVARTGAKASMYNADQTTAASRYNSDNSLRGQLTAAGATRASADARLRYDVDKDARDFNLRTQELDASRNANRIKQRETSEKAMVERIASLIPPTADGKPDTAAAAEQVRAMTARVSDRQRQLEAELQKNPNNAQARSELANITDNGLAALGIPAMDDFQTGMEAKRLRKESAGWMPWSGTDVESNKPITSLRLDEGLIWDDYVDDQGGRIPARKVNERREQYKHLIQGN